MAATGVLLGAGSQGTGAELTEFTRRVEAMGYDSMWLPEIMGREVMSTAGWLLASTGRLRVGTAIASVYARDASTARMGAHTLAELSGGRFELALGVSVRWLVEQRGQRWRSPLATADAYLDAYRETQVAAAAPERPAPLLFAAHGPKMIATVKDRVDGIMTINVPPAHTADVRAELRDDQRLVVLKNIDDVTDPDQARTRARHRMAVYLQARQYRTLWPRYGYDEDDIRDGGSDELLDMLVAWGDTDEIARQVDEYFAAGADEVVLMPGVGPECAAPGGILDRLAMRTVV